jgi:hypothetical protein
VVEGGRARHGERQRRLLLAVRVAYAGSNLHLVHVHPDANLASRKSRELRAFDVCLGRVLQVLRALRVVVQPRLVCSDHARESVAQVCRNQRPKVRAGCKFVGGAKSGPFLLPPLFIKGSAGNWCSTASARPLSSGLPPLREGIRAFRASRVNYRRSLSPLCCGSCDESRAEAAEKLAAHAWFEAVATEAARFLPVDFFQTWAWSRR